LLHVPCARRLDKNLTDDFRIANSISRMGALVCSSQPFLAASPPRSGHEFCTRSPYEEEEDLMWNEDEVRGKIDQAKGKLKETIGEMNDDEQLRDEGTADRAAGNVEEAFGKGRRKVGEAIKDAGKKISR
jgi:uncharacterized protein YjbJ (UPF0337 family)